MYLKDKDRRVTVRFTEDVFDCLLFYSESSGCSVSHIVREIVEKFVDNLEGAVDNCDVKTDKYN